MESRRITFIFFSGGKRSFKDSLGVGLAHSLSALVTEGSCIMHPRISRFDIRIPLNRSHFQTAYPKKAPILSENCRLKMPVRMLKQVLSGGWYLW
jgi:hypothetical protein